MRQKQTKLKKKQIKKHQNKKKRGNFFSILYKKLNKSTKIINTTRTRINSKLAKKVRTFFRSVLLAKKRS